MAWLSPSDQDLILHILLQIDDPDLLRHFQSTAAEHEWLMTHEDVLQRDLQAFFPPTVDVGDPETWRYIRGQLMHINER